MKQTLSFLLVVLFGFAASSRGEDDAVMLWFPPRVDLVDILTVYKHLTGKPVYVQLGLNAKVTIEELNKIPRAEAINLIKTTLLEKYGIELKTGGQGETLVEWSKDPKYQVLVDATRGLKNTGPKTESGERRKIRVINSRN